MCRRCYLAVCLFHRRSLLDIIEVFTRYYRDMYKITSTRQNGNLQPIMCLIGLWSFIELTLIYNLGVSNLPTRHA